MTAIVEGAPIRRVYNVHVYQPACPTNGTTDAQPYIQAVINQAITDNVTFSLEFDAHTYLLNNELDFGLVTKSFEMYGMGPLRTILKASATFGVSSGSGATLKARAIIRLDMEEAHGTQIASITLRDFDIKGANLLNDPIAIYWPYAWRGKIHRVDVYELGNTVFYGPQSFNVDLAYCSWTNCGSQSLEKWINSDTLTGTMTAGGFTLVTNEDVFTAADQQTPNRVIFVNNVMLDDNMLAAKIVQYNGPRSVTLDTAAQQAGTGHISYDVLKGSIPLNSKTLTVNNSTGIVAGDIGRFIYILGAGPNGESLNTMVTAVTGSTVTIKDAAKTLIPANAKRDVLLGPTISLAFQQSIDDLGGTIHTNDITLNDMQIEQFWGPAFFIHHGLGIYMNQFKAEGESPNVQNNFAVSRQAVVQSNATRMFVESGQWAYCFTGPDSGTIVQLGSDGCSLKIGNLLFGGMPIGTHLVEQSSNSLLVVGDIISDYNWEAASLTTATGGENVFITGRILSTGDYYSTPRNAMTPYFSGTFRSSYPDPLPNGSVYSFKPAIDRGIIEFWSSTTTIRGRYYFRCDSSPVMGSIDTPASALKSTTGILTGTTGVVGNVTVSAANNGRIYIENRQGSGQTIMWHILA